MADFQFSVPTDQSNAGGNSTQVTWPPVDKALSDNPKFNGYLQNQDGDQTNLLIIDVQASFSVGGSFAQSQKLRTWFSRNFQQPTFVIQGHTRNEAEYGALAEFIRTSQLKALKSSSAQFTNLVTLNIFTSRGNVPQGRNIKGDHIGYQMQGYINTFDRSAERFMNAPIYQMEFVMATSKAGLFEVDLASANALANWMDMYIKNGEFFNNPDQPDPPPTNPAGISNVPMGPQPSTFP